MRNRPWTSFHRTSWLNSEVTLLQPYKNICAVDDNQTLFGLTLFACMCIWAKRIILSHLWLNNAIEAGSRRSKYGGFPHPTPVLIVGWFYPYHNRKNQSERTQRAFSFVFVFLSWLSNGGETSLLSAVLQECWENPLKGQRFDVYILCKIVCKRKKSVNRKTSIVLNQGRLRNPAETIHEWESKKREHIPQPVFCGTDKALCIHWVCLYEEKHSGQCYPYTCNLVTSL